MCPVFQACTEVNIWCLVQLDWFSAFLQNYHGRPPPAASCAGPLDGGSAPLGCSVAGRTGTWNMGDSHEQSVLTPSASIASFPVKFLKHKLWLFSVFWIKDLLFDYIGDHSRVLFFFSRDNTVHVSKEKLCPVEYLTDQSELTFRSWFFFSPIRLFI